MGWQIQFRFRGRQAIWEETSQHREHRESQCYTGNLIHCENSQITALNWDELHVQVWPPVHSPWSPLDQLILCPSGPALPGDSKISDFQGSLKSELIGQVPRVPINSPSKTSSLICPFCSPQCLTSFHLSMHSYFFFKAVPFPTYLSALYRPMEDVNI